MFDLEGLLGRTESGGGRRCGCEATVDGDLLRVDAGDCPAGGRLVDEPACRATVVETLGSRWVSSIAVRADGRERTFGAGASGLFGAAGRFAAAVAPVDERLADRAARDPLGAATEATGRAGPAAEVAADAGLAAYADADDYEALLAPLVGPTISNWRVARAPPSGSSLVAVRSLDTHATARIYDVADGGTRVYHLEPEASTFDDATTATLAAAYEYLAGTTLGGGERAPARAVRAVADDGEPTAALARVLRKHTHEAGLLRDFFADPEVSDVFVTAPATRNEVRVRVDGETMDTNVRLTVDGVAALASRFRRESGRGFSRAAPTLDAATTVGDRRVRVAGVTEPVSDGQAFAFRAHDRETWTLPGLVGNDTLTAEAAGLLSVAVERGGATLLAGARASGKTTTLAALLWEIPPAVRTVVIEDAPELPVRDLQTGGRDVQALRADDDGPLGPAEALRAALRLGDGALVVGEVRGEEAAVLYEAMRVGANSEAVLGTVHGDGADAVFERVVSDLGVPASSFGVTDLIVSLETARTPSGPTRRVRTIEEVVSGDPVGFAPLFERTGDGLVPTGRLERGNSRLVGRLARPEEDYADVLTAIGDRAENLEGRRSRAGEIRQGDPPSPGRSR